MAFSEFIVKQRQNIIKECEERGISLQRWIEENIEELYERYIRQPYLNGPSSTFPARSSPCLRANKATKAIQWEDGLKR